LQKTLDGTALELVDNQKENMVGRKKLAESTRGESASRPEVILVKAVWYITRQPNTGWASVPVNVLSTTNTPSNYVAPPAVLS
jgi:hypothetical protein